MLLSPYSLFYLIRHSNTVANFDKKHLKALKKQLAEKQQAEKERAQTSQTGNN